MVLLGDVGQVEVGAEHTIDSEIILDTPDGTPRLRGSCGVSFWSIGSQCRCKIGPMELLGDVGLVESCFGPF